MLKQWGFNDKNLIPTVLNIPSTYKTVFGITYRIIKIGDEIFKDCDKLQIVTIPKTKNRMINKQYGWGINHCGKNS